MGKLALHYSKGGKGSNGGLTLHIDREQKEYSKNIDTSRSHLNVEFATVTDTIDKQINKRIAEDYKGKTIRKDAVYSCKFVLSGSHETMEKLSEKELLKWSKDTFDFFAKLYGEKNIIRCTLHRDEKTPHLHLVTVPLTKDGRLSAKEYLGDKKKLEALHSNYTEEVGKKYGLERGVSGANRPHLTTKDYYRYVNQNELTADKLLQHSNAKELVGKLIELADSTQTNLEHISHKTHLNHGKQEHQRPTLGTGQERNRESQRTQRNQGLGF